MANTFSSDDRTRLFKYLGLGATAQDVSTIDSAIRVVQANFDFVVPLVQDDLDTLDTLDVLLTTEQGSSGAGIIQADVVKYSLGGRVSGIKSEIARIRGRIIQLMRINDDYLFSSSVQVARGGISQLYRG